MEKLDFDTRLYGDDFHRDMLHVLLHILAAYFPPNESCDTFSIIKFLKQCLLHKGVDVRSFFSYDLYF